MYVDQHVIYVVSINKIKIMHLVVLVYVTTLQYKCAGCALDLVGNWK